MSGCEEEGSAAGGVRRGGDGGERVEMEEVMRELRTPPREDIHVAEVQVPGVPEGWVRLSMLQGAQVESRDW